MGTIGVVVCPEKDELIDTCSSDIERHLMVLPVRMVDKTISTVKSYTWCQRLVPSCGGARGKGGGGRHQGHPQVVLPIAFTLPVKFYKIRTCLKFKGDIGKYGACLAAVICVADVRRMDVK